MKTHIVDFNEWINSAGLAVVPPLVCPVDNIL